MYVPGLISLLGLPLLLLIMEPGETEESRTGKKLRFFLTRDKPDEDGNADYSDAVILGKTKGKKINTVEFWKKNIYIDDGDGYRHDIKLEFIEQEIRRMTALYDTSTILRVELGDGFSYGEFQWLINQMILYRIEQYALVQNSFYVFPNPLDPRPAPEEPSRTTYFYPENDYYIPPENYRGKNMLQISLMQIWGELEYLYWALKQNYSVTAAFVFLILIPFFLRIKKYRHFIRVLST
jgi:hypothetical protein